MGKLFAMPRATHLRKTAELCRQLAGIPTSGGHRADRVLLALAEKLEREAIAIERLDTAAQPTDDQLFDLRR